MKQQSKTKSLLSSTRACLAKRECELENLKSFLTKKIAMPVSQPDIFVYEWNITNWSFWCTSDLDNRILSKPVYTGPQGYCLCLRLFPAGFGDFTGSHVSVDAFVRQGD